MHTDFNPPFLLIRQDGSVTEFSDLVSLACAWRESGITVSEQHTSRDSASGGVRIATFGEWIVRDDRGGTVREDDIRAAAPYRSVGYWRKHAGLRSHAEALGLPIPFLRKGRRVYRIHRHPHGIGCYREHASVAVGRDDDVMIRGRIKLPPTAWDDIVRANTCDRSWKRFRKTRWRAK